MKYYVQIDRDDGSRTFKGPWVQSHCEREAIAWLENFPEYHTRIVLAADARAEVRAFDRAVKAGDRYYPPEES
jgi:hypothetical protein